MRVCIKYAAKEKKIYNKKKSVIHSFDDDEKKRAENKINSYRRCKRLSCMNLPIAI